MGNLVWIIPSFTATVDVVCGRNRYCKKFGDGETLVLFIDENGITNIKEYVLRIAKES